MISLGNLLIVDDSSVFREIMATVMEPYCDSTLCAATGHEGLEQIASRGNIDFVLCDVLMKDGDGFEVLERVASMGAGAPKVVLVTAFPTEEDSQRAHELGAIAYLPKPTTPRKILNAIGDVVPEDRRELKTRWRCAGKAYLIEGDFDSGAFVSWDVYNLSPTGAFLETKGPLPLGAEMDLMLAIGGRRARVTSKVVRIQEPSWINVGGAGVKFVGDSGALQNLLADALGHLEPDDTDS